MVLRERESRSPPVFIFEPLFLSFDRKRGFCVFEGFGFLKSSLNCLIIGKRFLFDRNLLNLGNGNYLNLPNNKIYEIKPMCHNVFRLSFSNMFF